MKALLALAAIGAVALSACGGSSSNMPTRPQRCIADNHRALIGTHIETLHFPAGSNVRVVCTTCAATQDFQRDRLNIRYIQDTGIITSVDCG